MHYTATRLFCKLLYLNGHICQLQRNCFSSTNGNIFNYSLPSINKVFLKYKKNHTSENSKVRSLYTFGKNKEKLISKLYYKSKTRENLEGSTNINENRSTSHNKLSYLPMINEFQELLNIYALPLYRKPAFPGFYQVLHIHDPNLMKFLLSLKKRGEEFIGGFLTKYTYSNMKSNNKNNCQDGILANLRMDCGCIDSVNDLYNVGTLLHILSLLPHPIVGGGQAIVVPLRRIRLVETISEGMKSEVNITDINTELSKSISEDPSEWLGLFTELGNNTDFNNINIDNSKYQDITDFKNKIYLTDEKSENNLKESFIPLPLVQVKYLDDNIPNNIESRSTLRALHLEIIQTLKDLLRNSIMYKEHFEQIMKFYNLDNPHKLTDLISCISFGQREELQQILSEENIEERLKLVLHIAQKDLEIAKLQMSVKTQIEEKLQKEQRKIILMEQLKFIKQELGLEQDEKTTILQKFQNNMKKYLNIEESDNYEKENSKLNNDVKDEPNLYLIPGYNLPKEVKLVFQQELDRISLLDISSAEFNIIRSYLEWLTSIPWGKVTKDTENIEYAKLILDNNHFGLKEVKERILELMATNLLRNNNIQSEQKKSDENNQIVSSGKILCIVGPPGCGKTSIVKSISEALGRRYYRISLGGLFDAAELRGHRRTYVGAMPGKFIQAIKHTGTTNPVILLDEIDKLGRDIRGDPSAILLEVLDKNQNKTFRDHYLDVPLDLSQVIFIATANNIDTIPAPLLDRMEIIHIAGYVFEEKLQIAKLHLLPSIQNETGLTSDHIKLESLVLEKLIKDYAREAGVRNLEKLLEKVYRKAALEIIKKENERLSFPFNIDLESLYKFIGYPPFISDRLYRVMPPGVVMGLAWTALGGATLFIEAVARISNLNEEIHEINSTLSPRVKVTGQLGDIMTESTEIAYTFIRNIIAKYSTFFDKHYIHIHVPEGSTPKDGPSAGITLATSLLSLAINTPVKQDIAMTGELSLTGKVLPIGGVKEKILAARRESVKEIILPYENLRDVQELEEFIKSGINFYFCDNYFDIIPIVFPTIKFDFSNMKHSDSLQPIKLEFLN
ncbi:ATP-dependent protease La family protein [Cryptosporidium muris RN66]|uniref:Lon protease homolog n=1 Tax=Cryptosporidium muris (strain RN66) TaxID=441375 RepID=B6ACI0_CRYMR|nr:ATP-dependent protease La family protein [Cryptosporidium muris RN66]EEA05834.1 ATP-dependent protease La family protein [Cryptosporidium muris RN66]|eukprot:XP_002140183.1 ATP-dependent protease La family protein [Cryptosporidium muris RN66]